MQLLLPHCVEPLLTSKNLGKWKHTGSGGIHKGIGGGGGQKWMWAHVPEHFTVHKGEVGKAVGKTAVSLVQLLLVSVMCKQLYWNWISSFTSGIHLEERWAADGKTLNQQTVPQQVHVSPFVLPVWSLAQKIGFGFWIFGYSDILICCCFWFCFFFLRCEGKKDTMDSQLTQASCLSSD